METTTTIAIITAQGHDNGGRRKMCVRAPTEIQKRDAGNDCA
jgi:hypothetical protein